jgi:hypothetical protein
LSWKIQSLRSLLTLPTSLPKPEPLLIFKWTQNINGGEDWNYIFVARDFDGNEDQPSEEDSDSDSDYIGEDKVTQSDIEDEPDIGPAIGVQNRILQDDLQGKSLLTPVKHVLTVMDALGINVLYFWMI